MNARRVIAVAVTMVVLALGACSDDPTADSSGPTTTLDLSGDPTPLESAPSTSGVAESTPVRDVSPWLLSGNEVDEAAGVPRILVSTGTAVLRVARGVQTTVYEADGPIGDAFGVGDGDVVVERRSMVGEDEVVASVVVVGTDGAARDIPLGPHRAVDVFDLVEIDGAPSMVYARFEEPTGTVASTTGSLLIQDLATGAVTDLGMAVGPEYLVTSVSAGTDVLVRTAIDGLGETIDTLDYTGATLSRPSPTDGDAEPATFSSAVISPDGTELAYLEGPGFAAADDADAETLLGDWEVVIRQEDGEQLRLTVADQSITQASVDFDGRWLLVSGRTATGPVPALLIDSEDPALFAYLVRGVAGHARLESSAQRPALP